MGFKKENYTLKGICICIYFLILSYSSFLHGQSHCPIRVEYEPRQMSQIQSANTIDEVKFPFFQQWNDLENIRLSDDSRASTVLPNVKRSTLFKGKNLGFTIPNGASISGIEIIVEGHTTGDGFVEDQMVRLLNHEGEAIGKNHALQALPSDEDWKNSTDTTDFIWRYGASDDNWGILLNDELVNNPQFGYALQVRNKLNAPVSVFIDQIQLIVYYTPLYEICSNHACVPFYVDDKEDPLVTYEWYIPQGFELISTSEEEYAINIGASYAEFGEYEICVESYYDKVSQGVCCRSFNFSDCDPGQINGKIFFDKNYDFIQNPSDDIVEGVLVNLFTNQGSFVASSISDQNGNYSFQNLLAGQYYVQILNEIDSLIFATPNVGNDAIDSDITGFFGDGTSDIINLMSGDSVFIDAGLNIGLNIGNFVWEDMNGDGVQQTEEPGIEGVEIILTTAAGATYSTFTNEDGFYSFRGLSLVNYNLDFIPEEAYIPTLANKGDPDLDSDNDPNTALSLSYTIGGTVDSIDAGFYRYSSVGDFVWEDLNNNGLQDENEPGISNVTLLLYDSNDVEIQMTSSDTSGFYRFEGIAPGDYYIEIQPEIQYIPTLFDVGEEAFIEINSNGFIQDDRFITSIFTLTSNTQTTSIDFGFIESPASVGGFTFLDSNNNGQYDGDESFVPEINVFLFNENDVQIDSTQSDIGGFYLFDNIIPGTYYIVFELTSDYIFTTSNIGDDLSDSDVDNMISLGSTELFSLMPEDENYSISAGYQTKPKVGDYVWLDENINGIQDPNESGLNQIEVELYNDQNELILTTTTTNHPETEQPGFYLFSALNPGNYYIKIPIDPDLDFAIINDAAIGLNSSITNQNGIGTSDIFTLFGNDCNLDIDAGYALKKGGIRGEVWIDSNEDGQQETTDSLKPFVFMGLYSESGQLLFTRTSDEMGQYQFSGLDEGVYYIVFEPSDQYQFTTPFGSSDPSLDSDVISENAIGSTSMITVNNGIIVEDIDAGLIDGSVNLQGVAWHDDNGDGIFQVDELPISGVTVDLYDLTDSLLSTTTTFTTGEYQFFDNLAGEYYLVFTPPTTTLINTIADQGSNNNLDDDVTSFFVDGSTDTIKVNFFEEQDFISAGYFEYATIGDQVFIDNNENGINDNEPGLDGVIVNLLNATGQIVTTSTTAQGGGLDSGYYLLQNVPPGEYTLQFIRPLFYQFIAADQGMDEAIDSDVTDILNNIGTTKQIEVKSGSTNLTVDAGVIFQIPTESSISGIIWDDNSLDGLYDVAETSLPLVEVQLKNQDGEVLDFMLTDTEGSYIFENLPEGFYSVAATIPNDKIPTIPNVGMDDAIDSDFLVILGEIQTEPFFLASFEDLENVDLGLVNELKIGNFVWEDANSNGLQDENEIGIEEVEITVTSENGLISQTVMTDAEGAYSIEDLPAGTYRVCVKLPTGFNFTKTSVGPDILDSDVDENGCTGLLDFSAGGIENDIDIGLTKNGSITGVAFVDLNGNGIINLTDPGLDEILVFLYDSDGNKIDSTLTSTLDDVSGIYRFTNLKATEYYLGFVFPDEYIITSPNIGDDLTNSDITGTFGEGSTDLFTVPSGGIVINISGGAYLPASIGDMVWLDENSNGIIDDSEQGVPNIEVIIFRSFGIPFDTTYTNESGIYQFENLKQGLYFIQFIIPQEFAISPADEGLNDELDSDADETGKTPLISLAHGATLTSIDCGVFSSMASLRSVAWEDSNGDGMRQKQEARIPGVRVSLIDSENIIVASTQTNSLGLYAFQEIPDGKYFVYVDLSNSGYDFTFMNSDDDDMFDNDINVNGESEIFTSDEILSTLSVPNIDIGLYEPGMVETIVWEDINADGIYDVEENPFVDVEASLYSSEGLLISKINPSEENNIIAFENIKPGKYFIRYKVEEQYVASPKGNEILEDNNSDVSKFEGTYITPTFQVYSNEVTSYIDAGFYRGSTLQSTVWYDRNSNGLQGDQGNTPKNIYATIFDAEGKTYGTKGINTEGIIDFKGIPKGEYYLEFYGSTELQFTSSKESIHTNSDVDHSNGIGTTPYFNFNPYESYDHIDAGLSVNEVSKNVQYAQPQEDENSISNRQESEELLFEVHPNPAANYLKINVDQSKNEGIISIRNNQNQLMFKDKVGNIDRIDLTDLHPGIYYIKYELNGSSVVKRILKIQ